MGRGFWGITRTRDLRLRPLPRASAAYAASSQPHWGRARCWMCLSSNPAWLLLVCEAGVLAGSESRHLPVPSFVSVLARPGHGFPGLNIFIVPFVLKAGLWLTHINTLSIHCCCMSQQLGNQENRHDRANGPVGWRAALRAPASPRCPSPARAVTACSRSAPPEPAASRARRADLSQLSPPQAAATGIPRRAGAGGLARGQGAPSRSLVSAGGG